MAKENATDKASGVLIYFNKESSAADREAARAWLKKKSMRLAEKYSFAPVEHWIADEPSAKPSRQSTSDRNSRDSALCQDLTHRFKAVKACSLNSKIGPAQSTKPGNAHATGSSDRESSASRACRLLEGQNGVFEAQKGLSTYWAQEYAGLDLAYKRYEQWHKEMAAKSNNGKKGALPQRARLLILDTSKNKHGERVRDLIAMNTPEASAFVPGAAQRVSYTAIAAEAGTDASLLKALDEQPVSDVVNLSLAGMSSVSLMAIDEYARKNSSVFVFAAGNQYPQYEFPKNHFETGLIVGSLKPDGLVSDFSAEYENVTILAPANNEVVANDVNNPFQGTSAAAPLVSSAMAMVKSILPELRPSEAKSLVQSTALPTFNAFEVPPRRNGAGTLNAYKLVNEAISIRQACGEKTAQNADCVAQKLKELEAAKPQPENELLERSAKVFGCPQPSATAAAQAPTCSEKRKLFSELRRAAFASPRNGSLWGSIGCIHAGLQLPVNQEFYRKLSLNGMPPLSADQMRAAIKEDADNLENIEAQDRLLFHMQKSALDIAASPKLDAAAKEWESDAKLQQLSNSATKSKAALAELVSTTLAATTDPRLHKAAVGRLPELEPATALRILEQNPNTLSLSDFAESDKDYLQGSDPALIERFLRSAIKNGSAKSALKAIEVMGQFQGLTNPQKIATIEMGMDYQGDSSEAKNVRASAIKALSQIPAGEAQPRLEKIVLSAESRAEERSAAFDALARFPNEASLKLIDRQLQKDFEFDPATKHAIEALKGFPAETALPRLRSLLSLSQLTAAFESDERIQQARSALWTSMDFPRSETLDLLELGMRHQEPSVRSDALTVASSFPREEFHRFIEVQLSEKDAEGRAQIHAYLAQLGAENYPPKFFQSALQDTDELIRLNAVRRTNARNLSDQEKAVILTTALKDKSPLVRAAALSTAETFANESASREKIARKLFQAAASDRDEKVAKTAKTLLRQPKPAKPSEPAASPLPLSPWK